MSIVEGYRFESMVDDPDDHRPGSAWALVVDPGGDVGRVDDLAVVTERIGPGDRIPLHIQPQGVFEVATLTGTNQGPWAGVPASGMAVVLEVLIYFPWDPVTDRFTGERIWFSRGSPTA